MARSFWLTLVCAVCLVVFVVKIEASPAGSETSKNAAKNSTKGGSDAGGSDEACDLDPEPEAEAEPTGNKHKNNSTAPKSWSDRQGKALDTKDSDKYNTTGHHDGVAEPEPESEPSKNGTDTATNASTNNQGSKSDNPTAGKSTASNSTTTTTTTPSTTDGGSKSVLSFTALALLSLPIFL